MTSVGDQARQTSAAEVLAGGGEMGALMRAFDWAATPLGPVEGWPRALKTCVRLMLTSRQPMWLGWGDELIFLYNDPYRSIVGGKHPQALGQPTSVVWREIWADIAPRIESALGGDEGTYDEALLLIMERHGYPEETYYTFSYSPIPDDDGRVAGIFCANTDDTRRVIGERQLILLRELAARTAEARTVADACVLSMRSLETNPWDVPFAAIYLLDPEQRRAVLAGTSNIAPGHPAAPEAIALDDASPWPVAEVVDAKAPRLIPDLGASFGAVPMGAWDRPPAQAVALPIAPSSQTGQAGILVVGLNPYRLFDDDYQGFLGLVAGQIASALADARAYEEERKRAEALAQLDRAKTAFFNNISHEFRTPLTLMLGPLEDVLATPTDAALVREQVAAAHRNSLRLLRLVNTLLDFARVEGARMEAVYEPTDLATLTTELAGVFRSAIERAGLRLEVDCRPLPEPVYVDRDMWEKIVLNLLSNALKFTLEGQIAVALRAHGAHVTLEVRDTGTGIPSEEIPHLFERFHRVRGRRARTHEGTGIGLALVRELVALHGGTIGVESVVDAGTTFTVTLPLGTAHLLPERIQAARTQDSTALGAAPYVEEALRWLPATSNASEPQVIADISTSAARLAAMDGAPRARVLLADDNADLRDYLTRLLASRYEVQAVANGAQALATARAHPPDLVLSDVMMPELDGFGLLRALRADPHTSAIPVVLLSARTGEESAVEGLQAGADDYLVKPFSARELLARVGAHLKLARARTQVARLQHVTAALSAAATVEEVADVIIAHGLSALGATVGVVAALSDDGASFTNVGVAGYAPEVVAAWTGFLASDAVPIADAVRAREPVILESRAKHDARYPHLAGVHSEVGDGALVAIPLLLGERVVGGLGLSFPQSRQFGAEERAVMGALGGLCAQALERARLYEAEQQARAEAEAERQHLHNLFMQAPAIICVLRGPTHVFDVANPLYIQITGRRDPAELLGRPIRAALPELEGQGYFELLDQVYASGTPFVGTESPVKLDRDGDGTLEEILFNFVYQPYRNAAGAVEGIFVHAVEVTEQVQARQRVEELARQMQVERDRWRQVLDVLPVGVVIVDAHGRIEVLNQTGLDIVGHDTRGESLPSPGEEETDEYRVRRPDGTPYPPSEVPLRRSLLYGEDIHGDQQLHRHAVTGRETPLLVNSAPLRGPDGAIVGAVAVFQDITELHDLEQAREEFLSSAAHDLKTPLTGIRGQAQLAQRRLARLDAPVAATAPLAEQLARIQEGTDAMLALINELVDVTRLQMGAGLELRREPTDLVALVRASIAAQQGAGTPPITLQEEAPVVVAEVDAARIARVVGNLLSNALKYSPGGGTITVRVAREDGAAVIAVQDEGIGIPAADLPHIFERFARAGNVAGHIQGTGIGLASARGIVEQHGGTIAAQSVEGHGATFTVRLPLEAS